MKITLVLKFWSITFGAFPGLANVRVNVIAAFKSMVLRSLPRMLFMSVESVTCATIGVVSAASPHVT